MRVSGAGASSHPLLPVLQIGAAILNFTLASLVAGDPELPAIFPTDPDTLIYAGFHILFIGRVLWAFQRASTQRARDLAMFTEAIGSTRRDPRT